MRSGIVQSWRSLIHSSEGEPQKCLLGTNFWTHGACSIRLPAWWHLYLQQRVGEATAEPRISQVIHAVDAAQHLVLDFLAPIQVRRHRRATLAHRNATKYVRRSTRAYTSFAEEILARSSPQPPPATQSAQRSAFMQSLAGFKDQDRTECCDHLWQRYQDLLDNGEHISAADRSRLSRALTRSHNRVDTERLIALFDSIAWAERKAVHYSFAINAALRLNDADLAISLHRGASDRFQTPIGGPAIIAYAAIRQEWDLAMCVWVPAWQLGMAFFVQHDLWTSFDKLSFVAKATAATRALHHPAQSGAWNQFVTEILKRTLQTEHPTVEPGKYLTLWHGMVAQIKGLHNPDTFYNAALNQIFELQNEELDDAGLDFYDELGDKFTPTQALLSRILFIVDPRHGEHILWTAVQQWRRQCGPLPLATYLRLLKHFSHSGNIRKDISGNIKKANRLFDLYIDDYKILRDPDIGNIMLDMYANAGRPNLAVRMFGRYTSNLQFQPDIGSYNTIIAAYARTENSPSAIKWFLRLQEVGLQPDVYSYYPLLTLFARRGDIEVFDSLLDDMQGRDIPPDRRIDDAIVLASISSGQLERAEATLFSSHRVRTHAWNLVLMAWATRNDLVRVKQLVQIMRQRHITATPSTYTALMTVYALTGQTSVARRLLQVEMPKRGVRTSVVHYAAVMSGHLRQKHYASVVRLYQNMVAQGIRPSVSTKNVLLQAAGEIDRQDTEAKVPFLRLKALFEELVADIDSVEPFGIDEANSSSFFEYAIFLYGSERLFDMVLEVYDRYMRGPARAASRDPEWSPPARMLSALLVAHKNAGNDSEVEECWALGLEKLIQMARKEKVDDFTKPRWVLPRYRFVINQLLMNYMDFLRDRERFDDIVSVVDDLRRAGFCLNHRNWNRYVQYLAQSEHPVHMIKAFRLTEMMLIDTWPGWAYLNSGAHGFKSRLRGLGAMSAGLSSRRAPTYQTMVSLASAAVMLERCGALNALEKDNSAPRSLDAAFSLPPKDDHEQRQERIRLHGDPRMSSQYGTHRPF